MKGWQPGHKVQTMEKTMGIRMKWYMALVNRVPGIGERYRKKRMEVQGIGRAGAWLYLLRLNISYYILKNRSLEMPEKYPYYEEKSLYILSPESRLEQREQPQELAKRLLQYDVISFDVFDTLIFRPFSQPSDLFYFIKHTYDYLDFPRIRCEMEKRAREELYDRIKSREITIGEIYEVLEREAGIEKQEGMQAELDVEYRFCYANPYMLKLVEELCHYKKRLIVISDMYLDESYIRRILRNAGYPDFAAYYVSCEYRCSKHEGSLYEQVRKKEREAKYFVHIGDNHHSDVIQAKKHGFDAVYYKNINEIGMPYRAEDMSVMTGGVYRGIVNTHLHNGLYAYSRPYEYGFVYGGLFAVGYCQFIHEYVQRQEIEKILFLARDGDILSKVYAQMYPQDKQEYVYWSRLAALKLSAAGYKYDYFRRFLYHKVNQGYTLKDIFKVMELEDMLQRLCKDKSLSEETVLSDRNAEAVKTFLSEHWEEVLRHYEPQIKAGKQYYEKVLQGVHRAAAVDIGWAGSGAVTLSYMMNEVWRLDCSVTGILAGTNSCHNYEGNMSEPQLENGRLVSWLFSQRENRDLWKFHNPGKNHNLYWEILTASPNGSLKGFYPSEDGGYRIILKEQGKNADAIRQVHQGIMDFVKQYLQVMGTDTLHISGRDAYAPMVLAQQEQNREYMMWLDELLDEGNVG